jgi:hypothetical protein
LVREKADAIKMNGQDWLNEQWTRYVNGEPLNRRGPVESSASLNSQGYDTSSDPEPTEGE